MKKTIRTALLVGLAATFVGCDSSGGGSGPANARGFCQEAIRVELAKLDSCGEAGYPPFYVSAFVDCSSFQAAQDAGRVAYDGAQASACLDALEAMSCVEYMTVDIGSFDGLPEECRAAMAPRVATGDPCYSQLGYECTGYCEMSSQAACFAGGVCREYLGLGDDCSSGQRCGPGLGCDGSTCGEIAARTVLGLGGNCSAANTVCDDPYYCCENGTQCEVGTCVARKAAGGECAAGDECQRGLRCTSSGGPATCAAPLPVGATCAGNDCAQGLYCNDEDVCASGPRLGDSCAEPESGDQVWCVDSWCNTSAEEPTCQVFLSPGEPCAVDSEEEFFLSCGPGYYCLPSSLGSGYGTCGRLYCVPFG
jgi:hypothetical protein